MSSRKEHDFIGELEISDEVYYGIQTFRATQNFKMSGRLLKDYPFFIKAFAQIKKAAALSNAKVGVLDSDIANALSAAADRIIAGEFKEQFVVDMVQGGAGTSTNMNVNEVMTNIALEIQGHKKGEYEFIHVNDHANLGQSTNDTYPSAIKVATCAILGDLELEINGLIVELEKKSNEFKDIIKMGRTELEDAVPTTLGNTFGAFASSLKSSLAQIAQAKNLMKVLNLGGTAIGTGINCHPDFSREVHKKLSEIVGEEFVLASDLISATQDTGDFAQVSGTVKTLAIRLSKIANDLRLMNSGPRCGLGEINLPQMQPGSSIMPGKVNPVIAEVVLIAANQIIANDTAITLNSKSGEFELNALEPGIAYALFDSITLAINATNTLAKKAIANLSANKEHCKNQVLNSVGIVTAFNPYLGYEKSASIAKEALQSGKSVGEIALQRGYLSKDEIDEILNPKNMLNPTMVK